MLRKGLDNQEQVWANSKQAAAQTPAYNIDILSSGFSCVVFKILDKSKKEGRVMEKILSKIVILIVWVVFSTSATACIQGGIPT